MEIEKQEATNDPELENTLSGKIQEYDLELNEIYTRVENLEEKLEFQVSKMNGLTQQLSTIPPINAEEVLIQNQRISQNSLNYQTVLRCLLGKHIGSNLEIIKLQEKLNHVIASLAEFKKKLEESDQRARFAELQYEINLTKLTKEYEKNQLLLMRQQEYEKGGEEGDGSMDPEKDPNGGNTLLNNSLNLSPGDKNGDKNELESSNLQTIGSNVQPFNARTNQHSILKQIRQRRGHSGADRLSQPRNESIKRPESPKKQEKGLLAAGILKRGGENLIDQNKRLEKTISDMARKQQNSDKMIETLRRKCEVLQGKYDQFKKQTAKEKFIGLPKGEESNSVNFNTMASNITIFDDNLGTNSNRFPFSLNKESFVKTLPFVNMATTSNSIDNFAPGNTSARGEKSSADALNSLNLLNFRDKRREEKQRNKFAREQNCDEANASLTRTTPNLDNSLGNSL